MDFDINASQLEFGMALSRNLLKALRFAVVPPNRIVRSSVRVASLIVRVSVERLHVVKVFTLSTMPIHGR